MGHVGLFTTRLCASDGTRNGRRTEAAEEEREREGARRAQMEIKRRRVRSTRLFTAPRGRCHGERRKCGRATTPHCSHPAGRGREEEVGGGLSICAGRTTKRMAEKQKAAAEATRYRIPIPRFGDSATSGVDPGTARRLYGGGLGLEGHYKEKNKSVCASKSPLLTVLTVIGIALH